MSTSSWLAACVLSFASLAGVAQAAPPEPQARRAIMAFISGDNNLEFDALTTSRDEFLNAYAQ